MRSKEAGYKLFLLLASAAFALVLGELTLRAITADAFYVWRPNLRQVFRPAPGLMPGIEGDSRFTINADGIRGDPLSGEHLYRILAVGASTTSTGGWPAGSVPEARSTPIRAAEPHRLAGGSARSRALIRY